MVNGRFSKEQRTVEAIEAMMKERGLGERD
jgi:hypothetical protein